MGCRRRCAGDRWPVRGDTQLKDAGLRWRDLDRPLNMPLTHQGRCCNPERHSCAQRTHTHTDVCVHTCTQAHAHTYREMHKHTHPLTMICMHIHTHTCTYSHPSPIHTQPTQPNSPSHQSSSRVKRPPGRSAVRTTTPRALGTRLPFFPFLGSVQCALFPRRRRPLPDGLGPL